MSRDPAGTYTYPPGIEGVPDQTIYSNEYNSFLLDVQQDLNYPRPIVSGGTGANNARDAMINLSGEIADQVVDNYNSFPFLSGSFYSDNATGHNAPVDGHAFIGICYMKDDDNIVLEARDESDVTTPGRRYVREKKGAAGAGVWGAWTQDGVVIADNGSITLPSTPPVAPTDATNKAYVDTGDTTNAAAAAAAQTSANNAQTAADAAQISANAANTNANNRVLRSGDIMSGGLTTPALSVTGNANVGGALGCGPVTSTGTSSFIDRVLVVGGAQPVFAVHNNVVHQAWGFWVDNTGGMRIGNTDGAGNPAGNWMTITAGAGMVSNQAALKPGGGPWADSSDARIKTVTGNYTSGLDAVAALNPVSFMFRGNDAVEEDGISPHRHVADQGTEFIGLIAQDAETVMPELVSRTSAFIDGVAVSDLRHLDTTPLIFALVNACKELKARIEALEG